MNGREIVVADRLRRAREDLAAARALAERDFWNACVNRLYYACFHAARALLLHRGFTPKTHNGVRTLLGRELVQPRLLAEEQGAFYGRLFNARTRSDYEDLVELDASARPWIAQAEAFVAACAALVEADGA